MAHRDTFRERYDEYWHQRQLTPATNLQTTQGPSRWSPSRFDEVRRLLNGTSGRCLEVGCGTGQFLLSLADQFDRLVGIDISETAIQIARASTEVVEPRLAQRVEFVCGAVDTRLPFADGSFDVVVASAIIEHVVDIFAASDEIARVCAPGGCAVVVVPNICYVKHQWNMLRGRVPLTGAATRDIASWRKFGWDGGHLHYFSKRQLNELLCDVGLHPEVWTGDGKWSRLRRWHPNLLGSLIVRARRGTAVGTGARGG